MTLEQLVNARKVAIDFTDGQKQALIKVHKFLKSNNQFFLLAGYSGCGKTTLAENIANATNAVLLAPTNAAVTRLTEKINNPYLEYFTIHSYFNISVAGKGGYIEKKHHKNTVLIIDECSMIDEYVLDIIVENALKQNFKVIFMGDSFQLEPVGHNPQIFNWDKNVKYRLYFRSHNKYELTEVKRYDGSLLKIATQIRENKKSLFNQPENSDLSIVPRFSKSLLHNIKLDNPYIVLTSTNQRRVLYNTKIRAIRFNDPDISEYAQHGDKLVSIANTTNYSNGETFKIDNPRFVKSFKIKLAKKEKQTEYECLYYKHSYNQRTILIPELVEAGVSTFELESVVKAGLIEIDQVLLHELFKFDVGAKYQKKVTFDKSINIATYGYAISCHKAQGQEWDNVYIDADWLMPVWDSAKWFYTAITRAKCKVEVRANKYLKILKQEQ